MSGTRLFTSESVTEGHPDKICDAVSDSVLDALLADDRVAASEEDVYTAATVWLRVGNSFVMQARLRRQHSSKTPTKSESQSFHMKR